MLGFDPLYLANEGRMVVFVPENEAARALELLRADKHTAGAVEIGRVSGEQGGLVKMKSRIGTTRIIDMNTESGVDICTLIIENHECGGRSNQTILEVAEENGIFIPTLCRLAGLSNIGACRMPS